MLVYPPSLDFILAFIACLKLMVVPIPVFPPHPARYDSIVSFRNIVNSSGAKIALTNGEYQQAKKLGKIKEALKFRKASAGQQGWPEDLKWIVTDHHSTTSKKSPKILHPKTDDLAFLQFTSGSTSEPKGVMITHSNLSDNLTKITAELSASSDTVVVSWLPQYHDMGLIGSYLGVIYCGGSGYYLSPLTFLQRPVMWIEAISKYKGTHLQAPNFAFKLTARKFALSSRSYTKKNLNLSSVRHIINAAEPVTEEAIEMFMDTFAPFGLNKSVMFPTYGLAEHTVFVCSGGKQKLTVSKKELELEGIVQVLVDGEECGPETSRLIGCGFPSKQNVDVQIVDFETFQPLQEDQVGEIWIKSNSKAAGYYRKDAETLKDFGAMLAINGKVPKSNLNDGYLRSGDLGFMHKEELFICGRIKDLIIVGGRNYYPQDLEATAESCDERIRPGCVAAFTVDPISGHDEEVALLLELREVPDAKVLDDECSKLANALKSLISKENACSISHVVILKPRTIPKTTSGKIARAWCRRAFLQNNLQEIFRINFSKINVSAFEETDANENSVSPPSESAHDSSEPGAVQAPTSVDPSIIRNMSRKEIKAKLVQDLARIISMPPSSISTNAGLATMMDSLSLSQFKGFLEINYAIKQLSDEYLFRENSNVNKLVEVVKIGYAVDDVDSDGVGPSQQQHAMVQQGHGGLSEALGCPPGVCCSVM